MPRYAAIMYNSNADQMCIPIINAPSEEKAIGAIEHEPPWCNDMYIGILDIDNVKWLLGYLEGNGSTDIHVE